MSKALFQQLREEEIMSLVSMPRPLFQHLQRAEKQVELVKHFNPNYKELYKKNLQWQQLQETINECRAEQKEIEFMIRDGQMGECSRCNVVDELYSGEFCDNCNGDMNVVI